jgi:hypothetical protein
MGVLIEVLILGVKRLDIDMSSRRVNLLTWIPAAVMSQMKHTVGIGGYLSTKKKDLSHVFVTPSYMGPIRVHVASQWIHGKNRKGFAARTGAGRMGAVVGR